MTRERVGSGIGGRARAWWRELQPEDGTEEDNAAATGTQERRGRGDRAALARLRRCSTVAEAMAEEPTLALFHRLGLTDPKDLPRVAVIASVLAHVRDEPPPGETGRRPPAIRAVGRRTPEDADSATMTSLRLRRLLACREDEELMREMRRFVALAGRRVDVADLASSLFFWGDPVRARWAFEYYAAGAAAPREPVPAA